MNSTVRFMLIRGCGIGRGIHIIKAKVKARIGATINMDGEDVSGRRGSLTNSFTRSARGWSSP